MRLATRQQKYRRVNARYACLGILLHTIIISAWPTGAAKQNIDSAGAGKHDIDSDACAARTRDNVAISLMYGASWRPNQGVLHRGPAQLCCLGPRMPERRTACLQRRILTEGGVRSSKITSRVISNSSACADLGISCQNGPFPQGQFHRQSCNLKN